MGRAGRTWVWLLWWGMAGCSDGANTQYRPIGSDCSSSDQCGTRPYSCVTTGYPKATARSTARPTAIALPTRVCRPTVPPQMSEHQRVSIRGGIRLPHRRGKPLL